MKKQVVFACLVLAFMGGLTGCKKSETLISGSGVTTKDGNKLSGGDGTWDLLGYGLDVTDDMQSPNSKSNAPIIDMVRFKTDFPNSRTEVTSTSYGYHKNYSGATATDYLRDYSKSKSFKIGANGTIEGEKVEGSSTAGQYNYSGSFNKNSTDQNISTLLSRYSYASYEVTRVVKRLQFTEDATIESLSQYLTPEFINYVNTMSAENIVARYGTHVMLDISIGGILRFNYSGSVVKETEKTKKVSGIKKGFSFGLLKLINVSLDTDRTITELTEASNEIQNKVYNAEYFGGSNSGVSISIDKDGNTAQTINLSSFESGITPTNAALVDVGKAVFIYHFIADPVKKAQVMTAIQNHITNSQKNELGELPVYNYWSQNATHHLYTIDKGAYPYEQNGYTYNGIAFYAFKTQSPDSYPVHNFWRQYDTHQLYTIDRYNYPYEQNGYTYYGIAFYAYKTQVPGTLPVHDFWRQYDSHHLYTIDRYNYPYEQNGYTYNGVAFYAYP